MEEKVKPFQKYSSEKKFYKVENSLEINFGSKRDFQSSFEISIEENNNDDQTKNWQINKIENEIQILENPFMEILHKMEQNTYPLSIKVDDRGIFIEAMNHTKHIESWKIKTKKWTNQYDNTEKFITQYLVNLENEELFFKNKYKEAFWSLLMFVPSYQNNGSKTEESIKWFIKGIDFIKCDGIIRADKRDYGFSSQFVSEFILDDGHTNKWNEKL
ncbi:MAG: hypothetical protein KBS61_06825 [Chryseobacterium sp.]|nr:hypothetical protein [Candidatus Chryseobacterium enterohippi]